MGRRGSSTPQTDLFAANSEPHGVDWNPLMTLPEYVWAMKWHNPGMSITIRNSNMAAAKPEIAKFLIKWRYKPLYLRLSMRYQRHFNGVWVQLSIRIVGNTVWPNRKCKNPRWWPLNFKYTYLCSQTRYQRNSNGYTYVFGVQLSIETHGNTMRPSREWKNARWRSLSFKCILGLQNDLYLATLPPPGKSKWRPRSMDCVRFSILAYPSFYSR